MNTYARVMTVLAVVVAAAFIGESYKRRLAETALIDAIGSIKRTQRDIHALDKQMTEALMRLEYERERYEARHARFAVPREQGEEVQAQAE